MLAACRTAAGAMVPMGRGHTAKRAPPSCARDRILSQAWLMSPHVARCGVAGMDWLCTEQVVRSLAAAVRERRAAKDPSADAAGKRKRE